MHNPALRNTAQVFCLACSLSISSLAFATDHAGKSSANAIYQNDVAQCKSGQSQQDQATCLKEAAAARNERRQGQIARSPAPDAQNARCQVLSADQRRDCEARIAGQGRISGSVDGGGILRETTNTEITFVPAQQP